MWMRRLLADRIRAAAMVLLHGEGWSDTPRFAHRKAAQVAFDVVDQE